jgi:hypothetical protein
MIISMRRSYDTEVSYTPISNAYKFGVDAKVGLDAFENRKNYLAPAENLKVIHMLPNT